MGQGLRVDLSLICSISLHVFSWSSASFLLFIHPRIRSDGMRYGLSGDSSARHCYTLYLYVTTSHGSPVLFGCLHRFLYNEIIHGISDLIVNRSMVDGSKIWVVLMGMI